MLPVGHRSVFTFYFFPGLAWSLSLLFSICNVLLFLYLSVCNKSPDSSVLPAEGQFLMLWVYWMDFSADSSGGLRQPSGQSSGEGMWTPPTGSKGKHVMIHRLQLCSLPVLRKEFHLQKKHFKPVHSRNTIYIEGLLKDHRSTDVCLFCSVK